ncbi:hypothetical protein K458DRAFT_490264 [Lentithecium fluviatile CBS 122367]|uniref:Uncharacterized protein n=1 Tax=Lentithecium fluviatile CBS 122367 TaxID=1168545 RepID=A0A6G1IPC1_9PLEO|nr:hypothetical protein K458DRAFT_490264 [Lentithecium fluviatile CBS 122367]
MSPPATGDAPGPRIRTRTCTIRRPTPKVTPRRDPSPPVEPATSPLPDGPMYDMEFEYALRVNKVVKVQDVDSSHRSIFFMWDLEKKVMEMIQNDSSEIDGREYRIVRRSVSFRVMPKGTWTSMTLEDFDIDAGERLCQAVDRKVSQFKRFDRVEFRVEVTVDVAMFRRTFPRNRSANELSSDPPEDSLPSTRGTGTEQLLRQQRHDERRQQRHDERRDQRQSEQRDSILTANDIVNDIHKHHVCREPLCDNHGHWCWVNGLTGEHFEIRACDSETWAKRKLEGSTGVSISLPLEELVEYWRRTTDNGLKVDRHTRKGKGKRRRASTSSDEKKLKRLRRDVERRQIEDRIQRMEDAAMDREERREQRRLEQSMWRLPPWQSPYAQPPIVPFSIALAPVAAPPPAAARVVASAPLCRTPVPSSSPVAGKGREDTRRTVREFFEWLLLRQEEDEQDDYAKTMEVAVEQRWTIEDLRDMSDIKHELYTIAVRTFRLKDGIVRHSRRDIRKYKEAIRTVRGLSLGEALAGDGAVV